MDGTATKLIISIVNYGNAERLVELTKKAGARGGTIMHGRGTAEQKWLQLLGLGDSSKEIVLTVTQQSMVLTILNALTSDDRLNKTSGIAIVLPVSMLIRRSLTAQPYIVHEEGEDMSASTHELISVIVNSGYADDVMAAARNAGAKGGTIINAQGTGKEEDVKFFGLTLVPEKEFVLILSKRENTSNIMNAICELPCLKKPGIGIAFCIDVDRFMPIGKK